MSSDYDPPQIPPTQPGGARKIWNTPQPGRPRTGPEGERFGFGDFIDIINPLQHIPIVSSLYRHVTGDQINPGARLIGGTLLGGPLGMAVATVNIVSEATTGSDAGEQLVAGIFGKNDPSAPPEWAQPQPAPDLPDTFALASDDATPLSNNQGANNQGANNQRANNQGADNQGADNQGADNPWGAPPPTRSPARPPVDQEPAQNADTGLEPDQPGARSAPPVSPPRPPGPANQGPPGQVLANNQPSGASAQSGAAAITARQPPPVAPSEQPLVGPRGTADARVSLPVKQAQFLPSGQVFSPAPPPIGAQAPGSLTLTGPLAIPLQQPAWPQEDGEPTTGGGDRAREDQKNQEQAQWEADRRAAAIALDEALRRAVEHGAPPGSIQLSG